MKLKFEYGLAVLGEDVFEVDDTKIAVLDQLDGHVDQLWDNTEQAPKWLRNGATIYFCEHVKRPLNFKVVHFKYKIVDEK